MNSKLIGIFGGTFDPVHNGHINAVNELQRHLGFQMVHWVLSARPPHKDQTSATIEQRFEMLKLALQRYDLYEADDCEIKRAEKSYTIDTVQYFKDKYPDSQICLIIGGDSLLKLHTWHRFDELIEMVHIVVMSRPGYRLKNTQVMLKQEFCSLESLRTRLTPGVAIMEHSRFDISSTRLRDELVSHPAGTSDLLRDWLPTPVLDYIQQTQSYKIAKTAVSEQPSSLGHTIVAQQQAIDIPSDRNSASDKLPVNEMNPEKIKDSIVAALEDIKGQEIRVIDINDISDFADFMIVVSGTSDTHVKALAREASNQLRKAGVKPLSEDGADIGEWVLVDFGDVVLHVMRPEVRSYYDLEKLWDEDVRELVKKHREQNDS